MNIGDLLQSRSNTQFPLNINNGGSQSSGSSSTANTEQSEGTSFADTLDGFVNQVNSAQKESSDVSSRFIKGDGDVDMHDVMIAAEKSKTAFQLLMELRNKGLDLYREAIRVQV